MSTREESETMNKFDLGGVSGHQFYEQVFEQQLDRAWNEAPGKEIILNALGRHRIHFPPSGTLIDIGCGTGFLLRRIQKEVLPDYRFVGVDFSLTAIAEGKKLFPEISLFAENGAATSLPGASFDIVVSYGSYEHFPDPALAIAEMRRLLKPAGHFFTMMPALEGYWENTRADEGWYPDKTGQPQWNFSRVHWESFFRNNGLSLWDSALISRYGARNPDVFFFGTPLNDL